MDTVSGAAMPMLILIGQVLTEESDRCCLFLGSSALPFLLLQVIASLYSHVQNQPCSAVSCSPARFDLSG